MDTSKVSKSVLSLLCITVIQACHRLDKYNTLFEYNYIHNELAHDLMASYIDNLGEKFIDDPCAYCVPSQLGDR